MAKVDFKNVVFTGADLVKFGGFLLVVCSMWIDLKTDQINNSADKRIIQYQIAELQRLVGVLPKEIKIERK